MGVPGNANPLLLVQAAAAGGYEVSRSLRFNSSDSAYCSRVLSSDGNKKVFTYSFWFKTVVGKRFYFLNAQGSSPTKDYYFVLSYTPGGQIYMHQRLTESSKQFELLTTPFFRDPSAWYHFTVAFDTTSVTASDRIKLFVNGERVVSFSTASYPAQNLEFSFVNTTGSNLYIGRQLDTAWNYSDGYLADVHFIDGQALTPSSFTEVDATTGQLIPKEYTGSYGTNGFKLDFADNSAATATTLGKDYSGNSNNWTPNNLSVTAGAGNDSLVDTPTSYGTDTGAGGEVRGNYATLNPLVNAGLTLSNGNLDFTSTLSNRDTCIATHGVSSGKWYWEYTVSGSDYSTAIGIEPAGYYPAPDARTGDASAGYAWWLDRQEKYHNGSNSSYGAAVSSNAVIGVALDLDGGSLTFYLNGSTQGSAYTGISGTYLPSICDCANASTGGSSGIGAGSMNFGQRPFAYTAPSGFKALCDTNLPAPVVAQPSTVMDVKLYTGNGSTQTISGLGFSPDLVWCKSRNTGTFNHWLSDTVRGAGQIINSDRTNAEMNYSAFFTAFTSNGFSLAGTSDINANSDPVVAWTWDAGTSTVTNTQGSITSQVRANASAGFSIVTYTGNGSSGATIGHSLGVSPSLILVKCRSNAAGWLVYHSSIGATKYLALESTAAAGTYSGAWNDTAPTSTVFSVGNDSSVNTSTRTYVAYCFAPVAGYSSAFSWSGTGSTDGPAIYLGFRPKLIIWKRTDSAANWAILDSSRSSYNVADDWLGPNSSSAEAADNAAYAMDFLSNGLKIRATHEATNQSGGTYVGFAFAESPFAYARAR